MNHDDNQTQLSDDLRGMVANWMENLEEIRSQMDEPPDTIAELIGALLRGDSIDFGDESVAIEMGVMAGRIEGLALARDMTAIELLAQLP